MIKVPTNDVDPEPSCWSNLSLIKYITKRLRIRRYIRNQTTAKKAIETLKFKRNELENRIASDNKQLMLLNQEIKSVIILRNELVAKKLLKKKNSLILNIKSYTKTSNMYDSLILKTMESMHQMEVSMDISEYADGISKINLSMDNEELKRSINRLDDAELDLESLSEGMEVMHLPKFGVEETQDEIDEEYKRLLEEINQDMTSPPKIIENSSKIQPVSNYKEVIPKNTNVSKKNTPEKVPLLAKTE